MDNAPRSKFLKKKLVLPLAAAKEMKPAKNGPARHSVSKIVKP